MFDVALIGAGPAGATAATYFANKGFNTLILEKEQFHNFTSGNPFFRNASRFFWKMESIWKIIQRWP